MKKVLLALLCIGAIAALPGCCGRKACDMPCEDYCEDECYDEYEDECDANHDDDVIGYEEQQGYRRNIYRRGMKNRKEMVDKEEGPKRQVYHKPIHPAVIEQCEAAGKKVRYLDERFGEQNRQLKRQAKMESEQAPASKRMRKEVMEMDEE